MSTDLVVTPDMVGARGLGALLHAGVRSLAVRSCNIEPHDLSELASLPSLTSLDLSDNPLGDEGCAALCTALLDAHLSTLVLDDCSIGSAGLRALLPLVREAYFLQSLSLAHNCIDAAGVATLVEYIDCCPALERLDVGYNTLGDKAHKLLRSATLRMLDLSYCGVTAEGAELLEQTLAACDQARLQDLRLSGNDLGHRGIAAIGRLLKTNTSLHTLAMRQCSCAQGPLTDLLAGLVINLTLSQVDLRDNAFAERVVQEVTDAAPRVSAEMLLDSAQPSFATARRSDRTRSPVITGGAVSPRRRVGENVATIGRSRKSLGQIEGSGEYSPQPTTHRTAVLLGSSPSNKTLVRTHSARAHATSPAASPVATDLAPSSVPKSPTSGANSAANSFVDEEASPRVPNRGPPKKGSSIKKKLDQVREKMSNATEKVVKTMTAKYGELQTSAGGGAGSAADDKSRLSAWESHYERPAATFAWLLLQLVARRNVAAYFDRLDAAREAKFDETPVAHDTLTELYRSGLIGFGTPGDAVEAQLQTIDAWSLPRKRAFRQAVRNHALKALVTECQAFADPAGRWDNFAPKLVLYNDVLAYAQLGDRPLGFGRPLDELLLPNERVPRALVVLCVAVLRGNGLHNTKLFYHNVNAKEQMQFCAQLERNMAIAETQCLVAGDVLMRWIGEVPGKLVSDPVPADLCDAMAGISTARADTLTFLLGFLQLVMHYSDVNRLDSSRLASVWAPFIGMGDVDVLRGWLDEGAPAAVYGSSAVGFSVVLADGATGQVAEYDERKSKYQVRCTDSAGTETLHWVRHDKVTHWLEWGADLAPSPPLFAHVLTASWVEADVAHLHMLEWMADLYQHKGASAVLDDLICSGTVLRQALQLLDAERLHRPSIPAAVKHIGVIALHRQLEGSLINNLMQQAIVGEVSETSDLHMVFRQNSIGSRIVSGFLSLTGTKLLLKCLKHPMAQLASHATAASKSDYGFIAEHATAILRAVIGVAKELPTCIRTVCAMVGNATRDKFSSSPDAWLVGAGGAFFLRFFCPAVLAPLETGVFTHVTPTSQVVQDVLVQVAAAVQCLANQSRFPESKASSALNALFVEPMRGELNRFLQQFDDTSDAVLPPRPSLDVYEEAVPSTLLMLGLMRDKLLFGGARQKSQPARYHIIKQ